MPGSQVALPVLSKRPFSFQVYAMTSAQGATNKRALYCFAAASEPERLDWVKHLRQVLLLPISWHLPPLIPRLSTLGLPFAGSFADGRWRA